MLYHLDDETDSMGVPALGHAIDQLAQAAMAMIPPPGAAPLTPINTGGGGGPAKTDGQPLMPRSRPGTYYHDTLNMENNGRGANAGPKK